MAEAAAAVVVVFLERPWCGLIGRRSWSKRRRCRRCLFVRHNEHAAHFAIFLEHLTGRFLVSELLECVSGYLNGTTDFHVSLSLFHPRHSPFNRHIKQRGSLTQ